MIWKYKIPKVDNTSCIWKYCIVLYYIQASGQFENTTFWHKCRKNDT